MRAFGQSPLRTSAPTPMSSSHPGLSECFSLSPLSVHFFSHVCVCAVWVQDPRASPQYGERVAYVVVCGEPGARLVDLVVTPHDVLRHPDRLRINGKYYITKQVIPALGRVFNLVGVNISRWFSEMKKPCIRRQRALLGPSGDLAAASGKGAVGGGGRRGQGGSLAVTTIDQYYVSDLCEVCGALCRDIVCTKCKDQGQVLGMVLATRASVSEKTLLVRPTCLLIRYSAPCWRERKLTCLIKPASPLLCPVGVCHSLVLLFAASGRRLPILHWIPATIGGCVLVLACACFATCVPQATS